MEKIIEIVKEAYITVYGEAKWISLTDSEKHDVIMILVKDMNRALEA